MIIVGAGPVGLSLAIDLAIRGIKSLVLEARPALHRESRAICYAKRSLEILDRLGIGEPMLAKGVTWQRGRVFWGRDEIFAFDLLLEGGHRMPAFVNCQQYYLEQFLIERAATLEAIDLRWRHRVVVVQPSSHGALLEIETSSGRKRLSADFLLACDGARSEVRKALQLPFLGKVFQDRFLIADVKMETRFPAERWFWFDPPFHQGGSALLHRQPDNICRIDLQLGRHADPAEETRPERVLPRLRAMLGEKIAFSIEWVSIYTFQCRRIERFGHGRVFFLGDAAHQVSPFGARGFNSGLQDADNLAWKLALVLKGSAPETLLLSYDAERRPAADENIRHSTRSTEFIAPANGASLAFRNAVLELARQHAFARAMINSGRLSTPAVYADSPLNTPVVDDFEGGPPPGAVCRDAPLLDGSRPCWLLHQLGDGFRLLLFEDKPSDLSAASRLPIAVSRIVRRNIQHPHGLMDEKGLAFARYDARPGSCYLVRPDQHVAARWRHFDAAKVAKALQRSTGFSNDA